MRMNNEPKIFGREWEEIRARQQGTFKPVLISGPPKLPLPTEQDYILLKKFGIEGLKERGSYGVLDRLSRA